MSTPAKIDVAHLIDTGGIGRFQVTLFALCAMSLIMDGFDVQAMAYVAPAVIDEFGITGSRIGDLIAAANSGVLVGSLVFTVLADKIGRRPVLIIGTFFFAILTLITSQANSVGQLLVLRFIGGIGMGSIIPNATALIGEYSPSRLRVTLIMTITVGFTAGGALGAFVSAAVIPAFGWRSVFYFGGVVPLVVGVLMLFWLPESLQFLAVRKRFDKIGRWIERLRPGSGADPADSYVVPERASGSVPVVELFTEGRTVVTLLYWLVNFTNLLNLYFLAGLLPTILSQSGMSGSTSNLVAGAMQLGGTIGAFGLAWMIARKGFTPTLTLTFALASAAIALVGNQAVLAMPFLLTAVVFVAGWSVIGGQPGLNAFAAMYYPTHMRSTGIGWGLGIGRIGAILGPFLGGRLLGLEWTNQQLFLAFAVPAAVSTAVMFALHLVMNRPGTPVEAQT
jgi:AAHS family 4-hydroxybenzoate transporter-like MFS transporter